MRIDRDVQLLYSRSGSHLLVDQVAYIRIDPGEFPFTPEGIEAHLRLFCRTWPYRDSSTDLILPVLAENL